MVLNLIKSITYAWSAARRAWIYRDWLAHDVDYDWAPLAKIMELKLDAMAKVLDNGHHVSHERDARECRVAAELCRRLRQDDYTVEQEIDGVPRNDQRLLGWLIGRKLRNWWD